jgi:hypothetical protein
MAAAARVLANRVANLPYHMVCCSVLRNAPFLLLPSYISRDNHYRQALIIDSSSYGVRLLFAFGLAFSRNLCYY